MATKSTLQVMTGITYHMKKAGYVVTLVPMSTQVYTGEDDKSANSNLRNEIVKYRMQPYDGGKPIDGTNKVNVLDLADALLLQWYSGFDAALCANLDDPKACSCNKGSPTNACGDCASEKDCGNSGTGSFCWAAKDPQCSAGGAGWCTHSAPKNACGHCSTESDCGNMDSAVSTCWAAKDWQCPSVQEVVKVLV